MSKTSITKFFENQIRTSLANKAYQALLAIEVRILIFDDPAKSTKEKQSQRRQSGFSPVRVLIFCQYYYIKKKAY
jgi:hypothetical protein